MNLRFLFLLWLNCSLLQAQNPQMNMTLLSHWNDTLLPAIDGDQRWNDVMGWNDTVKNREYLIAGSNDSIYFFDITNPFVMVKCAVFEGHARNAINRDYETYDHYLYTISDRSSPTGALQIFDMQYLPDSVVKVYDKDTFSINTHTLFIEAASKRLYLCTNTYKPAGFRSMAVFDLSNPELPSYLGELDKTLGCAYTHEVYIRRDTAYCSCGNAGLFIVDMRDLNNQKLLGSITPPYVQSGFNHSGWLDSTGRYLMFTDENQGLGIKIYDISDKNDPQFLTVFNSHPGALPHNAYWKGGFAYVSSYEDGVYIYDLRNIASLLPNQKPPVAGFYDTYTLNKDGEYHGFHGCWGVWPYLKSGLILASDISEGLFVFRPSDNLPVTEIGAKALQVDVWPNPCTDVLHVQTEPLASVEILDLPGKIIATGNTDNNGILTFQTNQMHSGMYLVRISTAYAASVRKFMVE